MDLEVCIDSVESAVAAESGGARRVELCSGLLEGGLTPGAGLIAAVRRHITIGLFVMVRPLGGDFCYTDSEFDVMREEIAHARQLGADGIVVGILDEDARVDVLRTRQLVELAGPLPVTFHRAIDMTPELPAALDAILETGARRVLTSGGKPEATLGCREIAQLVDKAQGRIGIMPGSGVNISTIEAIAELTGASEFHSSARTAFPSPVKFRKQGMTMGATPDREYSRFVARQETVCALVEALDRVAAKRAAGRQ